MKHVIIGTAGHVDHGKTTLIKALTGTDTDRLKEEQERGMTIDLGFAALALPDGTKAGIVDVPGHERFLKNMLAGAGGGGGVLLVIAADESVMPQTVEHLGILRLLDVKNSVVAFTQAGSRVAVNLAGVETEALERGALLAAPATLAPSQIFDATLRMLKTAPRPLQNRARVRVYLGTAEILGRVQIIGADEIPPGGQGYVQFRAEFPFACSRSDRFVVRSYSPMTTIGGGI